MMADVANMKLWYRALAREMPWNLGDGFCQYLLCYVGATIADAFGLGFGDAIDHFVASSGIGVFGLAALVVVGFLALFGLEAVGAFRRERYENERWRLAAQSAG